VRHFRCTHIETLRGETEESARLAAVYSPAPEAIRRYLRAWRQGELLNFLVGRKLGEGERMGIVIAVVAVALPIFTVAGVLAGFGAALAGYAVAAMIFRFGV
jgi:hypothetical protein